MARSNKQKNKHRVRHNLKQPQGDGANNSIGPEPEDKTILPYTIQHSPVIGRYLQAARHLKMGETILKEEPLVVGPVEDTPPICIGCYRPLDYEASWRCEECGFPLCSANCHGKGKKTGHGVQECALLNKTPVATIPASVLKNHLEAIAVLRGLALRETDPTGWNVLCGMEAHTEQRRKVDSLWNNNEKNVVHVIREQWGLQHFGEELIHHISGVLEVNAFEVGPCLRAVYPTAYLFAHNCIPNTRHSDDAQFEITFRTTRNISNKEMLFATYTYVLQGTLKRRQHLRETKFFECECSRCRDATECGTNISALKCPQCLEGLVISTQPLDPDALWACTEKKCPGYVIPASAVASMTECIFDELNSIDGNDIPRFEAFLHKYSTKLHKNHYLCLSALHCLFQLYGKIDGFLINNLTDYQLERKVEICRILLQAFDKLDPGFSKQRGLILYELHAPLMILLQRSQQERRSDPSQIKRGLREVFKCLEESKKLLEVEPAGSQEAEMALAATDALERLTTWRNI